MPQSTERFRHEDIASVPTGWKVRTVTTSGGHRVRVAFPPGRKVKGSGRLVSILHPLTGPNPCGNPCTVRSSNPQELIVMGANAPRRRVSDPVVRHQIKIAKDTLRMADAMVAVMGGMTKDQARQILRQYGIKYTEHNRKNPATLDAFTKKHLAAWLDRIYLYGADKRHAKKIILATLKQHPDLLAAGRSWPEILRMGEASGINPRHSGMPSNPWFSEKIDQGNDRVVIWATSEAGPFHAHAYHESQDLGPLGKGRGRHHGYSTIERARKIGQKWLDEQRTTNPANQSSVYSKAVSLGYPYLRGEGRVAKDGRTWLSRVTKAADGTGAALFVGWDLTNRKWIVEQEGGRNPHELLIMAANPRVEVVHGQNPPVEDIHEEFTGQEVKWIDVYDEPHMPAGKYAELGSLIALYVKPVKGGQVLRIGAPENHDDFAEWWDNKPPLLVTDSSARQIYFVNGCQDLSNLLEQFGALPDGQGSGLMNVYTLGQIRRIDYECRKEHVADPDEDRWKHDHGEEDGELPTLVFDASAKRMSYRGGNYRIEGPWIKN